MVLDQQKKLIHSYYELDNRYRDVAHENKFLRNEFKDLKKKIDVGGVAAGAHLQLNKKTSFNTTATNDTLI